MPQHQGLRGRVAPRRRTLGGTQFDAGPSQLGSRAPGVIGPVRTCSTSAARSAMIARSNSTTSAANIHPSPGGASSTRTTPAESEPRTSRAKHVSRLPHPGGGESGTGLSTPGLPDSLPITQRTTLAKTSSQASIVVASGKPGLGRGGRTEVGATTSSPAYRFIAAATAARPSESTPNDFRGRLGMKRSEERTQRNHCWHSRIYRLAGPRTGSGRRPPVVGATRPYGRRASATESSGEFGTAHLAARRGVTSRCPGMGGGGVSQLSRQ